MEMKVRCLYRNFLLGTLIMTSKSLILKGWRRFHSLVFIFYCQQVHAYGFEIQNLPIGKSVTLPRPATTLVPLDSRVRLTATDHQQSVKFTSVSSKGTGGPFKLAIYDSLSEKVRYVNLKPGTSVLYHFQGINTIQILPTVSGNKTKSKGQLQIESNKPLGVGR